VFCLVFLTKILGILTICLQVVTETHSTTIILSPSVLDKDTR
jgi:hypothetical protein